MYGMTARSTTRPLVCVLLVLFLCVQVLAIAAPAGERDGSAEFRGIAAPSSTALLRRGSTHNEDAAQRPSAPSLFPLVPRHGGACDPGRLARAVERHLPLSLWTAGPPTRRSP